MIGKKGALGIFGVVISVGIVLFIKAKYNNEDIALINENIMKDINAVAVYLQDEGAEGGYRKADTIPTEGYTFNEDASYCTVNGTRDDSINLSYNGDTQSLSISPLTTKGTKCYLYFDEKGITNFQELIASKDIQTRTDFSTALKDDTTGIIYQAQDDNGTTYYFAGNPSDNWVSFAGFYWRIIRINGDGSIRLIYQGTSANTTGTGTQIGTSAFNSTYSDNMYVGYMYTSGNVHGTGTNSTIKGKLDDWYETNIADKGYSSHVDTNAGFCNDRTIDPTSSGTGLGKSVTYYGARYRLYSNKTPTFECSDKSNDLFTVSSSNKGNKKLTYPVGLITADEVAYAGGVYGSSNNSYYLYTGQYYWTMSPFFFFSTGYAYVFPVSSTGSLGNNSVDWTVPGVRPVINLKADTAISGGNGTAYSPFEIQTN